MLHLMQSEDTIDDWTLKGLSEKRVQARDSYLMWRIENNADFSFDIKLDLKRKIEKFCLAYEVIGTDITSSLSLLWNSCHIVFSTQLHM